MGRLGTILQVGRSFGVRDGVLRLKYELKRSSGLMSWKMRSAHGWDSWTLKQKEAAELLDEMRAASNGTTSRRFFFGDAQALAPAIRRIISLGEEQSILAQAEKVLVGELPYFGKLSFQCGFPPRWFENPVTGQKVSERQSWTQMRFASAAYGDLKFILEPSRFLFVYPLVRAYALSGDERFPQAFWGAVEDWARNSPPTEGPLWICGQECSLRILAWSFALHAFIHSPSTTSERVSLLASMIAAHSWRIAQTVDYARSQRSNHLISEGVGLWTAGTLFPEMKEARVWKKLGAHLLREALLDQITSEGVSQQHSFNYQRMIVHLLLWTVKLAEVHVDPLGQEIRERTQAALEFMRPWLDETTGFVPNYGSDDGSLIFPVTTCAYRDFRPMLQLGGAVLNRSALRHGPWDEAALWFGVNPVVIRRDRDKDKVVSISSCDETGYFRLGDKTSWAMIRAGRYTRRPFQADQLHVDLWWQGLNLARDAGTYLYNGPPPWNNALAGTAVHNTIMIDGLDQMRRASRFLWVDWAQAAGRLFASSSGAALDCFAGKHDGYRSIGVEHRRTVRWLPHSGWVIVDDILGAGEHDVRLHWLAADLPFEISEPSFEIVFTAGKSRLRWNIFSSRSGNGSAFRAGKLVWGGKSVTPAIESDFLLGWESGTYGDLRPALSLVYQSRALLPTRFITAILTNDKSTLQRRDGELVISSGAPETESEVYRVKVLGHVTQNTESHTFETKVEKV